MLDTSQVRPAGEIDLALVVPAVLTAEHDRRSVAESFVPDLETGRCQQLGCDEHDHW